jgi:hypothetical protein
MPETISREAAEAVAVLLLELVEKAAGKPMEDTQ